MSRGALHTLDVGCCCGWLVCCDWSEVDMSCGPGALVAPCSTSVLGWGDAGSFSRSGPGPGPGFISTSPDKSRHRCLCLALILTIKEHGVGRELVPGQGSSSRCSGRPLGIIMQSWKAALVQNPILLRAWYSLPVLGPFSFGSIA